MQPWFTENMEGDLANYTLAVEICKEYLLGVVCFFTSEVQESRVWPVERPFVGCGGVFKRSGLGGSGRSLGCCLWKEMLHYQQEPDPEST